MYSLDSYHLCVINTASFTSYMPINYKVKQGDCIASIAFEHGFFPESIWDHPENQELKKKRQNSNKLLSGDIVFIPDLRLKETSRPTNQVHKFKCKNTPKELRLQFFEGDEPLAKLEYVLDIDGIEFTGSTDSEGIVKQFINPDAKLAKLTLENGLTHDFLLGHMDPPDELTGIQGMLHRLGLFDGELDGKESEELKLAIAGFQRKAEIEETGEPDANTRQKLEELTGR